MFVIELALSDLGHCAPLVQALMQGTELSLGSLLTLKTFQSFYDKVLSAIHTLMALGLPTSALDTAIYLSSFT